MDHEKFENIIMMGYSNTHTQNISDIIPKYKVENIRFLLELLTIT
jgi:lipoate-protein ligase B